MSEEKNLPRWIAVAASITTLAVPLAYIFGYAYDQGYLHVYGVSNEFFARSIQEYLVFAFFACLGIATLILDYFTHHQLGFAEVAIVFGGFAWLVIFEEKHQFGAWLRSKAEPLKKHRLFDYFFFPFICSCIAFVAPALLILTICIFLLIPAIAYYQGQDGAEKEIAKAKACTCSTVPMADCVSLLDENGKPIASGKLVARNETHIALFNQGKTTIYPVKDQIIEVAPAPKSPNAATKEKQG